MGQLWAYDRAVDLPIKRQENLSVAIGVMRLHRIARCGCINYSKYPWGFWGE